LEQLHPSAFQELHAPEKLYAVVLKQPTSELIPLVRDLPGMQAEEALAAHIADAPGWARALATWRTFAAASASSTGIAVGSAVHCEGCHAGDVGSGFDLEGLPQSFRVSGKRSGRAMAHLGSNGISEITGEAIAEKRGWQVALRGFDVEVVVHVNDELLIVALPLLERTSARQSNFGLTGLSQPVAWAMAKSASIERGELVLDPMCGSGIILLEAAQCWPGARYLGFDSDAWQLQRSAQNLALLSGRTRSCVGLARGDGSRLPLPDACADVVLCDLPFGKQFGSLEENETLYPAAVNEFRRVLKTGVGRAVLLTNQVNAPRLAAALLAEPGAWEVTCRRRLTLGFMEAVIFLATATATPQGAASNGQREPGVLPPETVRLPWEDGRGRAKWSSFKALDRQPLQPVMSIRPQAAIAQPTAVQAAEPEVASS